MKLLLSGSDLGKLERVRNRLLSMGVACDIVYQLECDEREEMPSYPDLWVQQDEDFDTAMVALKGAGAVGAACQA